MKFHKNIGKQGDKKKIMLNKEVVALRKMADKKEDKMAPGKYHMAKSIAECREGLDLGISLEKSLIDLYLRAYYRGALIAVDLMSVKFK